MTLRFTARWRMTLAVLATAATVLVKPAPSRLQAGPPGFSKPTSVQLLAKKIDHFQKYIDEYGTVVSKHPDVWGDGRLAKHRIDVEQQLKEELGNFNFRLNAAVTQRDAAYLGQALSISTLLNGPPLNWHPGTAEGETPQLALPAFSEATAGLIADPNADPTENIVLPRRGFNTTAPVFIDSTASDPKDLTKQGISLEPSLVLDQHYRYLQHLNQLRRMNESDDVSDSPGYSLNLVRLPISVLPGRKTSHGYGAEITYTVTPHLTDNLLPSTMRDLVLNQIAEQYTVNLIRAMNQKLETAASRRECLNSPPPEVLTQATDSELEDSSKARKGTITLPGSVFEAEVNAVVKPALKRAQSALELDRRKSLQREELYLNARAFLTHESKAAYDVLSEPDAEFLWTAYCTEQLGRHIALEQLSSICETRQSFLQAMQNLRSGTPQAPPVAGSETKTELTSTDAFAWLIVLHTAAVQHQLKADMQRMALQKDCACVSGEGLSFVGPRPCPEACAAFNEYVRCRWPVIVFALDPMNQEQNIGVAYESRREMQIAAAVAAANGKISLQKLTRFARRLELDLATIDLNRTDIGFAHGNDTFGWRFLPRVQAPPVDSNLKVVTRDLLWGGPSREDLLKHRKLEPGMRECTAIVLMPSFVPYITIDSRASWFRIDNKDNAVYRSASWLPSKSRLLNLETSMDFSREITSLRELSMQCFQDSHLYRDGDVKRLLTTVDQLDRSLPLQTAYVQMPFDSAIVPSDLFSSGGSGMAPVLEGWYGEPGILVNNPVVGRELAAELDQIRGAIAAAKAKLQTARISNVSTDVKPLEDQIKLLEAAETDAKTKLQVLNSPGGSPSTTLFLMGKHFSLFNMRVIAGGVDVSDSVRLISRNLCQVTIPASVSTVREFQKINGDIMQNQVVDVHVASTYGVTQRLSIPAILPEAPKAPAAATASITDLTKRVSAIEKATIAMNPDWEPNSNLMVSWVAGPPLKITMWKSGQPFFGTEILKVTFKSDPQDPFDEVKIPPSAEFAAWIIPKGKKLTDINRVAIPPMKLAPFGNGVHGFTADQMVAALANLHLEWTNGEYEIHGFLRFPDVSGRPTFAMQSSLPLVVVNAPMRSADTAALPELVPPPQ